MALALLPFFQFFRRDVPHRLAAIKQLEESLPAELLEEDAAWIQAWKASGIDQEVFMPQYFRQLDLPNGPRMCFTSAAAMSAAFHRKVETQEEYNVVRSDFGDTSSVQAQVAALESLGLRVQFTQTADAEDVMEAIDAGIPVMVGWLHRGPASAPTCGDDSCGHWSLIYGYSGRYTSDATWLMSDPAGVPDLERGGHNQALSGQRVSVRQAEFHSRWQVEGPHSGWAMFVEAK